MSRRLAAVLAIAGALGGCVSLTPTQQSSLDEMKAFSRRVTDAYHVAPIFIQPGTLADNAGARLMPGGVLQIYPDRLGIQGTTWLFAHELGHYVLGHRGESAEHEMDANAESVKIMSIGLQIPEEEAYYRVNAALWWFKISIDRGTRNLPRGHRPICEEISDLAKRYPAYPATTLC